MTAADKRLIVINAIMDALVIVYLIALHNYNKILNAIDAENIFEEAYMIMSKQESWIFLFIGFAIALYLGISFFRNFRHYEEYSPLPLILVLVAQIILFVAFISTYTNPLLKAALVFIGVSGAIGSATLSGD